MKVITKPTADEVSEALLDSNPDGASLVARWRKGGALTAFRYHYYTTAWYCAGEDRKYSLVEINKDATLIAFFYDELAGED